jgi:hypothetical protein
MPSGIPQYYEGGPARQDNWFETFLVSGSVSVGNAVAMTSTPYTIATNTSAGDGFILGIVITTGALAGSAADVQVRGVVNAVCDAAITAGQYVKLSGSVAGDVAPDTTGTTLNLRAIALSTTTGIGQTLQIMLY